LVSPDNFYHNHKGAAAVVAGTIIAVAVGLCAVRHSSSRRRRGVTRTRDMLNLVEERGR
jgi:hypothetical protein